MHLQCNTKSDIMTSSKIHDIRRVFAVFDRNSDGSISIDEIRSVLRDADVNFSDEQLELFMNKLDNDGDGTVDYEEFCRVMADVMTGALDVERRIKAAFRAIDTDGNGQISQSELRQVVLDLGESITAEESGDIISVIDKDGDREINFEEFVMLMYMLNLV